MRNKTLIAFLLSLCLFLICSPLKKFGLNIASIIEVPCYIILTYFILTKYSVSNKCTLLLTMAILLGRSIIEIPLRFDNYDRTRLTLMVFIFPLLAIVLTSIYYSYKRKMLLAIFIPVISYCLFIAHDRWREYVAFGQLSERNIKNFVLQTKSDTIKVDNLSKRYLLLNFWSSSCGVCRNEMPAFLDFYQKNKEKIDICSVFIAQKNKETFSDGEKIINNLRCDEIPLYSISQNDTLLNYLSIYKVPTIILLDSKSNVIFKGSLEFAKEKIKDSIDI